MMRIASILLVATLLTTCAISGTFAKYVTKASGEDSARVAKWGIVLGISGGDVFDIQYPTHEVAETGDNAPSVYEGEYSVISALEDKVVAPGTSSEDLENGNLTATVKGTPEVATRYSLTIKNLKDVVLPEGEYTDYTNLVLKDGEYGYFNTFKLAKDYYPVKWDIKVSKAGGTPISLVETAATFGVNVAGFSFAEAEAIVNDTSIMAQLLPVLEGMVSGASNAQVTTDEEGNLVISMDFDPNKVMDFKFELSWAWAFETEIADATYSDTTVTPTAIEFGDMADTYLGNVAAAGVVELAEGSKISTDLSATLVATAVQID